jgi:hypothetical protein
LACPGNSEISVVELTAGNDVTVYGRNNGSVCKAANTVPAMDNSVITP